MKHPQSGWFIYDTETGGLDSENNSLLTFYAIILDANYEPLCAPLDLKIKPDDGIYRVTAKSLEKNKIDLVEHDKVAITVKEAGSRFWKYTEPYIKDARLGRIGQNEEFDKNFLVDSGMVRVMDRFFNRKILDTKGIATYLQVNGFLPEDMDLTLVNLAKHFGIDTTDAHNAGHDVLMTLGVLQYMNAILKGKK